MAHAHWFKFIGALMSDKYHFVVMSFSGMGEVTGDLSIQEILL